MKTVNDLIHKFPNGAIIHLRRVIFIGAIDKNVNNGNIFLPVHVTGMNKPIEIILANAIGATPANTLEKVGEAVSDFTIRWMVYLQRKEIGGNNG